jgi:hypothetical protein
LQEISSPWHWSSCCCGGNACRVCVLRSSSRSREAFSRKLGVWN